MLLGIQTKNVIPKIINKIALIPCPNRGHSQKGHFSCYMDLIKFKHPMKRTVFDLILGENPLSRNYSWHFTSNSYD